MQLELVKTTVYDAINPEGLKHPFVIIDDDVEIYIWSASHSDGGWVGYPVVQNKLDNGSFFLDISQIYKECFQLVDLHRNKFQKAFNHLETYLRKWENRTDETVFTPEESDIFEKLQIVFPHIVPSSEIEMPDEYFCELYRAYQDLKNEPKKKAKKKGNNGFR